MAYLRLWNPQDLANLDSTGKEFWIAIPNSHKGWSFDNGWIDLIPKLMVSGEPGTTGTVTIPGISYETGFVLPASGLADWSLPLTAHLGNIAPGVPGQRGIHIQASAPISVQTFNWRWWASEGMRALPYRSADMRYMVTSAGGGYPGGGFSVLAGEPVTEVTITPTAPVGNHPAGVPFVVTLQAGEAYWWQSPQHNVDYTGTLIEATKPVLVTGDHECANIPATVAWCNALIEQMLPMSTWGKSVVAVPLAMRVRGDLIRVLAAKDGTEVKVNGQSLPPLAAGRFHEMPLTASSFIQANQPIQVTQFSQGAAADYSVNAPFGHGNADPFMMQLIPLEQHQTHYQVAGVTDFASYINLVALTEHANSILLDGLALPNGTFSPIAGTPYSAARVSILPGASTTELMRRR